jgi:hypothetical protein
VDSGDIDDKAIDKLKAWAKGRSPKKRSKGGEGLSSKRGRRPGPQEEERPRMEIRDRKEADRKKVEAEAFEMQRARQQRQRAEEKEERREKEERQAREKEERARAKDKSTYRRLRQSGGPSGIPEHEDGYPRPGTNFNTDEDIKKGRSRYDGN